MRRDTRTETQRLADEIRAIEATLDRSLSLGVREATLWAKAQRLDRRRLKLLAKERGE